MQFNSARITALNIPLIRVLGLHEAGEVGGGEVTFYTACVVLSQEAYLHS